MRRRVLIFSRQQSVALARFYCILVAFGILVTFVAQLITVIIHFTLKVSSLLHLP